MNEKNWDHLDDYDFDEYKQIISTMIYKTKEEKEFWAWIRQPSQLEDTVAALNEIRQEQAEVARGKKAAGNASWPHTALFVKEVECRLTGIKNKQHDRQIAQLKRQIATLESRLDTGQQAA